jgi:septal ring factor EnvC (AmiA/AmiB activator)
LETQQNIIDQLQEDVALNRSVRREVEQELLTVRNELREMRHENANLRNDVRSSRLIISKHEATIAELESKLEALGA